MPVYVDPLMRHGGSESFRWSNSCHCYADSVEELLEFCVRRLRMKSEWFQNKRVPHFDLNANKYRLALAQGVKQHTRREAVEFWVSKGWHPARLKDMEFEDDDSRTDQGTGADPGPTLPGLG